RFSEGLPKRIIPSAVHADAMFVRSLQSNQTPRATRAETFLAIGDSCPRFVMLDDDPTDVFLSRLSVVPVAFYRIRYDEQFRDPLFHLLVESGHLLAHQSRDIIGGLHLSLPNSVIHLNSVGLYA